MKLHASGEDYLEAILVLQKKMGMVRPVDIARHMGFTKPSITHAITTLQAGGFVERDEGGFIHLTDVGREVAERTYEKHCFFISLFLGYFLKAVLPSVLLTWAKKIHSFS